ncbi:uncharacterized protein LOC133687968 [Populus nigra]|uniref:uncharacterized protein LOC133687968 n=1 Tax=Populus nigra TaxID=3691 RepID=UPI002B279BFC|nr:uncharacterized protein LOC133687968 [Populus nigra]XP_061963308.1 uncharacterized protein LOC133687968 [Populus nigra]
MDNQTKPNSGGSIMISASELRRRAVRRNVLVKSLLPQTPRVPHDEIALEDQSEVKIEPKSGRYKYNTRGTPSRDTSDHRAPHVPSDKICLETQNRSEVKVEPKSRRYKYSDRGAPPKLTANHKVPHVLPNEIGLEAQNRFEVKVELKSGRYQHYDRGAPPGLGTNHKSPYVPPDKIGLEAQNRVKVQPKSGRYKYSVRGAPPKDTLDHKPPHVSPDEIDLEAQNQSEVKVEPQRKIALQVQNKSEVKVEPKPRPYKSSASWPLRHTSDHKTPHVPHNEIALEPQNRSQVKVEPPKQVQNLSKVKAVSKLRLSAQDQINEKTTEWALLITSVLLEAMSAVFDQVGQALTGMVIAFLALFFSSLDLICKARKEGVKRTQPFGGLLEYFGLAAAVWQCFYSTMEYLYTRKNQQNPIKMCLLPFIFALCVLIFRLIKCRT